MLKMHRNNMLMMARMIRMVSHLFHLKRYLILRSYIEYVNSLVTSNMQTVTVNFSKSRLQNVYLSMASICTLCSDVLFGLFEVRCRNFKFTHSFLRLCLRRSMLSPFSEEFCGKILPFMIPPILQNTFTVFHQNFADIELINS